MLSNLTRVTFRTARAGKNRRTAASRSSKNIINNGRLYSSKINEFTEKIKTGPSLGDFLRGSEHHHHEHSSHEVSTQVGEHLIAPYLSVDHNTLGKERTVHIESFGCQMNMNDTEIVYSIMEKSGYKKVDDPNGADVVFLNTCAIRDHAETKVWSRLGSLRAEKTRRKEKPLVVGVLGCMAERLKEQLLEKEKVVDLVAGPDAYRDLPQLLSQVESGQQAMNVMLSLDETYADITPVRMSENGVSSYVSIMRGCNNMCTYCIVPFTRGRERSRNMQSILDEVRLLSDQGFKEVVLLGQNVNSYNDRSLVDSDPNTEEVKIVPGFSTVYKRPKAGISFAELMDKASQINPEMRIRFTSPHPKDFPDELLQVMRDRPNLCKSIHIPAQSGSTTVLDRMRRGYSREAYLSLIEHIRDILPGVSLSSDFISGFCGETEQEHRDTITLMEQVKYDSAFMFAYSMREKTPAHRKFKDDVPEEIKKRRLHEVIETFHLHARQKNKLEIGKKHLVLVEGTSKRSDQELFGRSDTNKKVIFAERSLPSFSDWLKHKARQQIVDSTEGQNTVPLPASEVKPGEYIVVKVESSSAVSLKGKAIAKISLTDFYKNHSIIDSL
jgi:tRNA-N(6)-(isopentenyl)adenosine-37 thiotransferase enzyme MiaB